MNKKDYILKVDSEGKITISLGGKCTLNCKHCYTNTSSFVHQPQISPKTASKLLQDCDAEFSTICVSGDIDCFLDPELGIELLTNIVENFETQNIMFTTRLIPQQNVIEKLIKLGEICTARKQLFIPCISLVSFNYPNVVENAKKVNSSIERLDFFKKLSNSGLPCFLTLRPTFPFSLVPFDEIEKILDYVDDSPAAVLGEVLLLDAKNEIAQKLAIVKSPEDQFEESKMTFIEQPIIWKKLYIKHEHRLIKEACNRRGLPFFLRSMSAVHYLKRINIFDGQWRHCSDFFDTELVGIYP